MNSLARKKIVAFNRLKAEGVKGITRKQYAALTQSGWEEALKLTASVPGSHTSTPTPSPAPKRKHKEAEKPKDQKTKNGEARRRVCRDEAASERAAEARYTDLAPSNFERKWDGEPYQKFNPLDYIRKIQEIAKNAPKIPERVLRAPDTSTLESEENTNGKEQNDGRRAA